jgi:hypothetical protein
MQQMQDYQTPGGRQGYLRTGQAQAETRLGEPKLFEVNYECKNSKHETLNPKQIQMTKIQKGPIEQQGFF